MNFGAPQSDSHKIVKYFTTIYLKTDAKHVISISWAEFEGHYSNFPDLTNTGDLISAFNFGYTKFKGIQEIKYIKMKVDGSLVIKNDNFEVFEVDLKVLCSHTDKQHNFRAKNTRDLRIAARAEDYEYDQLEEQIKKLSRS